tara:strand:+ start:195 stop:356 length:162 start_codon:yes stop_codon:yes gene_type:complete
MSCQNLCLYGKNNSIKKKYCKRPGPPYSAKDCLEGDIKIGNGGQTYIRVKNTK